MVARCQQAIEEVVADLYSDHEPHFKIHNSSFYNTCTE